MPSLRRALVGTYRGGSAWQSHVLDALPAHVAVVDQDGIVQNVNAAWREFAESNGLTDHAAGVGSNYLAVCEHATGGDALTAQEAADGIRRTLDGRSSGIALDYACHSPDHQRWFRMMTRPLRTGTHARAVVMHFDITDQKLAEEAVRRSLEEHGALAMQLAAERARLIDAQAVAKIGSWETDLSTLMTVWSSETHRIFGTDPETFQPSHAAFIEMVHSEDRAAVDAAFQDQATGEEPRWIDHRIIARDGTPKFVEERWQLRRDASGRPVRAIGTCQDITERRTLEQQFLRAQRIESVGSLVGGIAHDLNNVLAPILMSVDLLREQITNDSGLKLLAALEESAARGADLVRQVLTFARGAERVRAPVRPDAVVRDLTKVMRETFPKTIEVRHPAPSGIWTINGDRTQIHQVVLNLCVNARDAMPRGGILTITVTNVTVDDTFAALRPEAHAGQYVRVSVADTGVGIPAELRERIFEPFFTTKDAGKGTGLGLSTSQAIVISHGGFMQVTSEVGRGTTFDIYLPAHGAPIETQDHVAQPELPQGRSECVLLVDDEEAVRMVAQRLLVRHGYRVLLAVHGAEAMSRFAEHQSDIAVIITDMAMPVMDGAALIAAVRSLDPDVRIIASSGRASGASAGRALSAGANRFVAKPYSADSLLTVVREVLDQ